MWDVTKHRKALTWGEKQGQWSSANSGQCKHPWWQWDINQSSRVQELISDERVEELSQRSKFSSFL